MIEKQDRNGVKVRVDRRDGGTVVEADCQCFGHPSRAHSNADCPNRPKICGGCSGYDYTCGQMGDVCHKAQREKR